jgi:uncharacterized membrane-anchored protein YjiN (DUF445 family)
VRKVINDPGDGVNCYLRGCESDSLDLDWLAEIAAREDSKAVIKSSTMNERQQAHIDFYLERLGYWKQHRPASSTARLLAARDADEAHPLRSEEEATEVVEYLWRLEKGQATEQTP